MDAPPKTPCVSTGVPAVDDNSLSHRLRQIPLSFYGLFVGILSLGLATIPSIAMERPLPNPFETPTEAQRRIDGPPLKKGGVTFKLKGFSVNLGGKDVKNPPALQASPAEPQKFAITNDPVRWFTISALACGLFGLALSSVAHVRERRSAVTVAAMSCSIAAIIWQYVVFGIVLGVAIVVVLLILKVLAG